MNHLILGGARSGKSRFAETCAIETGKRLIYIATAAARDDEMLTRIDMHKQRRDSAWCLLEEEEDLGSAIGQFNDAECAIVVDCLTLWLSNCLANENFTEQKNRFIQALSKHSADIFIVSNEVGSGVVPLGELSRVFVDQSGWLHQELAKLCDKVSLIVAGLPLSLK